MLSGVKREDIKLPHSVDNELGLLSSIVHALRRPDVLESRNLIAALGDIPEDLFYAPGHKELFIILVEYASLNREMRLKSLSNYVIETYPQFRELWSKPELKRIFMFVDCPHNWEWYLELLKKYSRRRKGIFTSREVERNMFDLRFDIPEGAMSITI